MPQRGKRGKTLSGLTQPNPQNFLQKFLNPILVSMKKIKGYFGNLNINQWNGFVAVQILLGSLVTIR